MSECNCYHGMDCNKITVCAAENMVENATEELQAQLDKAIKWIQHDCPWDEETIRAALQEQKP